MNYEARDKYGVYKEDASSNYKPGSDLTRVIPPNVVRVYNRRDDGVGQKDENHIGNVQHRAEHRKGLNTKIYDPLTHDYVIYTGITIVLGLIVVGAHLTYGDLAVAEWQLSMAIENLPSMNPWTVIGGTAVVGLLVLLTPRLLNRMRHRTQRQGVRGEGVKTSVAAEGEGQRPV